MQLIRYIYNTIIKNVVWWKYLVIVISFNCLSLSSPWHKKSKATNEKSSTFFLLSHGVRFLYIEHYKIFKLISFILCVPSARSCLGLCLQFTYAYKYAFIQQEQMFKIRRYTLFFRIMKSSPFLLLYFSLHNHQFIYSGFAFWVYNYIINVLHPLDFFLIFS